MMQHPELASSDLSLPRNPCSLRALNLRRGVVGCKGNVRTPRFPALLPSPLPSNSGRFARGEPGTPSSASCAAARAPKPSPAMASLRPTRLGLALQSLV
jgi:hypothetical protein